MNRRKFLKCAMVTGLVGAASTVVCSEFLKYPAIKVKAGDPGATNMLVRFNGDFLSGCRSGDTESGVVTGFVVNSKGQMVINNAHNEVVDYAMRGNVEIWAVDDGVLRDIKRTWLVRKCSNNEYGTPMGYYGFWRFPKAMSSHMERIA